MKNLKKLAALVLTLMMLLSVTAFAQETPTNPGSITINGVGADTTYEIYKLLDLESYDTSKNAYSYKVNEKWTAFFATDTTKNLFEIAADTGYVTWKGGDDPQTVVDFAKAALAYAKANTIAPVKSSKNAGEFVVTGTTGVFSNLELGYYLVDSTMGALCGLTTTNPAASINAKNSKPTIDKQVQEDSTNQWGDNNTADIGQTVNFRVTVNVHAGAENYVLHDEMSAGLTFKPESVEVRHVVPNVSPDGTVVGTENYEVVTAEDNAEEITDGCTFEVHFTKEFCDTLKTNDKLLITYSAMLNRNAIVAQDGNPNTTWLDYGENHKTTEDSTKTYTFGFDIVKTDGQNTLLDGAKFKIYDAKTGGNEVAVVLMDDGVTYRRARADETGVEIVVKDGKVRVVGFDNGTYYLEETKAPDGYNKLTTRQEFSLSDANLDATFNDTIYSSGSGVHVVNRTGAMLPETGGVGTTLFYIIGGVLVVGAVVLLVAKKRMKTME